jgi:hypothetical protein
VRFFFGIVLAVILALAYACAANGMSGSPFRGSSLWLAFAAVAFVAVTAWGVRGVRRAGIRALAPVFETLVLIVLVAWGLQINHFVLEGSCRVSDCAAVGIPRVLAEPQVLGLLVLHVATVVGYAVSRRRPEALRPSGEALLHALLLLGFGVQVLLALQFADLVPLLVMLPLTMPVLAPYLGVVLFGRELFRRLCRRGRDSALPRALVGAGALAPLLLGAHAVLHALWLHDAWGAARVFTRTCGHTLSRVPVQLVHDRHCHYLCTVAARGHVWLVAPERFGTRRGATIVVNRQLAVANAFEDLLHERWPRLGALARRSYDRLGWPVARLIRWRWLADVVYVAMKPAEWSFVMALLLLDRTPPEFRIDRMYR